MKEIVFIIGGCRSGKSRYALELASKYEGKKYFMATLEPLDNEMEKRIADHQKERGDGWITIEAPVRLPDAIDEHSRHVDLILVDCLTLWISNLMMKHNHHPDIGIHIKQLIESIIKAPCSVILVSNEVGAGIVPENKMAREFRDLSGFANQRVASCAQRVIMMVAGIPIEIKK